MARAYGAFTLCQWGDIPDFRFIFVSLNALAAASYEAARYRYLNSLQAPFNGSMHPMQPTRQDQLSLQPREQRSLSGPDDVLTDRFLHSPIGR